MKPWSRPYWFTAAQIAALRLPGLPANQRWVNERAAAEGWADRLAADGSTLSRRRAARGGGVEYHASLFPPEAQEVLAARALSVPIAANDASAGIAGASDWTWFDQQSASTKARSEERAAILAEVDALTIGGASKTGAIRTVAHRRGVSPRAIAGWFASVAGVPITDRLPHLAPQYKGGGKEAEIDAEAWRIIKTDYLRAERPAFAACYNRLIEDYARPRGIALPDAKTLKRRLDREISSALKTAKRHGREASRRSVPPQRRTVMDLHAMQAVNADGHTFDVFVQWEDGRIGRPVMVGMQDVFSRKLLSHRIGETESTLLTRLAFADLFRDHCIPAEAVMDNGRAFASKALTGGALTRFRFKVKDTDATGVLIALGIRVHWTMPYRGSSKPIERAWRDLCEDIAKHPAVAGAYTGNRPDAKPENYRERAIPIAEFRAHVTRRIAAHNARTGRRTEAAQGGSFDATFAASYAVSPVGRASSAQLRLALLVAEDRRCDRASGAVTLAGNTYWSPDMIELAGKVVTLRFDPDNLHSDVHVYQRTGEYVGAAPVIGDTGFSTNQGRNGAASWRRRSGARSARRKTPQTCCASINWRSCCPVHRRRHRGRKPASCAPCVTAVRPPRRSNPFSRQSQSLLNPTSPMPSPPASAGCGWSNEERPRRVFDGLARPNTPSEARNP